MESLRKFYSKYPVIITLIIIVIIMPFLHWFRQNMPFNTVTNYLIAEGVVAIISLGILCFVNGPQEIVFSTKGLKYTVRILWFLLFYAFLVALVPITLQLVQGTPAPSPFLTIIECLLLGLFVGLFEESLFRGLFLSSLLKTKGETYHGVLVCCIISSLLFGFVHIYPEFFGMFTDPSTISLVNILQMIGKIITTGLIGFAFAVVYIRTHNLWGVAIFHGLNDAASFLATFLFNPNAKMAAYVDTGAMGKGQVGGYVFQFIVMFPIALYAYRQLKYVKLPQWGLFKVKWEPQDVEIIKKKKNK